MHAKAHLKPKSTVPKLSAVTWRKVAFCSRISFSLSLGMSSGGARRLGALSPKPVYQVLVRNHYPRRVIASASGAIEQLRKKLIQSQPQVLFLSAAGKADGQAPLPVFIWFPCGALVVMSAIASWCMAFSADTGSMVLVSMLNSHGQYNTRAAGLAYRLDRGCLVNLGRVLAVCGGVYVVLNVLSVMNSSCFLPYVYA